MRFVVYYLLAIENSYLLCRLRPAKTIRQSQVELSVVFITVLFLCCWVRFSKCFGRRFFSDNLPFPATSLGSWPSPILPVHLTQRYGIIKKYTVERIFNYSLFLSPTALPSFENRTQRPNRTIWKCGVCFTLHWGRGCFWFNYNESVGAKKNNDMYITTHIHGRFHTNATENSLHEIKHSEEMNERRNTFNRD